MIALINNTIGNYINLGWLTGPFLDKELRVSSRQLRNFLLRSIYIIALLFFVVTTWGKVFHFNSNMTFLRSRLAEAGRMITITIIQFQFVATQLTAVILFCNSINNEIYHRTLGVLLTTPVTSFQIVMGKILSKLFQIIILISISLPLLAIIRIFGGVQLNYILISLCLTLAMVIFAGSLSLFFSVIFRRTYIVIIVTIFVLGILCFFREIDILNTTRRNLFSRRIVYMSTYYNPFERIAYSILHPEINKSSSGWLLLCSTLLFVSFILLLLSSILLRKIALANAFGQKSIWKKILRQIDIFCDKMFAPDKKNSSEKIRPVWGPAVAWKEMKMKYSSREKMYAVVIIIIEIIMIVAMYIFPYMADGYGYGETLAYYLYVFLGLGIFSTVYFSVKCIASEKESHTWSCLLMTPLSDWQIMSGKFIGILRRVLPVWVMLFIFLFTFSIPFNKDIKVVFVLAILMIAVIIFLYGAGLYFSSRFKNTNSAIIGCFIFICAIWVIYPHFIAPNLPGYLQYKSLEINRITINPFTLARNVIGSEAFSYGRYSRWSNSPRNISDFLKIMSIVVIIYITAGVLFAWRAKRLFRKYL